MSVSTYAEPLVFRVKSYFLKKSQMMSHATSKLHIGILFLPLTF